MDLKKSNHADTQHQSLNHLEVNQNKPLRILMVLHMPWTRELGAPRVSLETAEELRLLGHHVDKFDINDAFPRRSRLGSFFEMALFPARAARYVKQNAHLYDVIQAEQGNLPYTKEALGFVGILIARSHGLYHFYAEFQRTTQKNQSRRGSIFGNVLRWMGKRMDGGLDNVQKSFDIADAIFLMNSDELSYISSYLSYSKKAFLLTTGLSENRFKEFAAYRPSSDERLANQQVVFIGNWGERKGSSDFPALVHAVRQYAPQTRFLLLGTGKPLEVIQSEFNEEDKSSIEVVPFFQAQDLPRLLSTATVGVLPSYIEGFGIGVLEQLAAGIPSIAYDVPGPREMLKHFSQPMLTPLGDTTIMAERIVALLSNSSQDYLLLHNEALDIAARFRVSETASQFVNICCEKLENTQPNE